MSANEEQDTRKPADKRAVEKLPVLKIGKKHCKKGDDGKLEQPTCPVCVSEIELGESAMFMPCGHIFHPECLKPWLIDHNTCPVCRHELPVKE